MKGYVKEWRSAPMLLHCGFDWDHVIKPGEPYLAVVIDPTLHFIRCRACAVQYFPHDPHDPLPPSLPEAAV